MGKIFKTRKDVKIFAALAAVLLLMLIRTGITRGFEKSWYNMGYDEYEKDKGAYSVASAEIVDFETRTGFNDKSLSVLDIYYTDIVEFTYAGGQSARCRVSRKNGDKIGDMIEVAYDKRYDTEYDKMLKATEDPEETGSVARTEEVSFNRLSLILTIVDIVLVIVIVLFMIRCGKKDKAKPFWEE